ncbi:hypothetical protein M0R72_13430 [Candidatus Pacearchaeota archaeon]|jgi:hypothetical protein|nr:hypothetical protein [Candidatus Pacearchaeota archaeon]
MKAKDASLWAKILAALIAIGGSFAVGRGWLPDIKVDDVLKLSAFVAVVFVTVDLNLLAEKVFHWTPAAPAPPAKANPLEGMPG